MVGSFVRLAAAALLCAVLAACTSAPDYSSRYPDAERSTGDGALQCVPYAREQSHVQIYGDAYTWWDKAEGRFARSGAPSEGAVMVLYNYAGPNRAHVAVVREIVNPREIRVDHANWLDDGAIYVNDPVQDVSPGNDWSQVRVFNIRAHAWGGKTYQVQGFIGPGPDAGDLHVAQNPAPRQPDAISALLSHDNAPTSDQDDLEDDDIK
jgi:surface antigen